MHNPNHSLLALALLFSAIVVSFSQEQTRMILTGFYDSECLNPLPQTSHPNPQICAVGQCCSRSDGTTSLKLISCGALSLDGCFGRSHAHTAPQVLTSTLLFTAMKSASRQLSRSLN
jgi:hypothetical protein